MNAVKNDAQAHESGARANPDVSGLRRRDRKIRYIAVDEIAPNPMQPRADFNDESLNALSESICRYGFIQPLTVKKRAPRSLTVNGQTVCSEKYELVSGERRYRAAKRLGLKTVPCIVVTADMKSSALIALTENLQRENLNFFEEAAAFYNVLLLTGATQTLLARQLSISQSAVANKIRLLSLSDEEKRRILDHGLTERHARAFLRLKDEQLRRRFIDRAIDRSLSAAECEKEIAAYLSEKQKRAAEPAPPPKRPRRISLIRDINFFLNSLNNAVNLISESGIEVKQETTDLGDYLEIVLNVRKG